MKDTIHITSQQHTMEIAKVLARHAQPGMVFLLEGELGAGKTTFTKGFAQGLGIEATIKSPTYTLIREYEEGTVPFYHMDLYRLEEVGGGDLGLEEYFYGSGICVVEWASFIPEDVPEEHMTIRIERVENHENERTMHITATGERYTKWLHHIGEMI